MFNYLYQEYKLEILNANTKMSLKEMQSYEKAFVIMLVFGAILSTVCSFCQFYYGRSIGMVILAVGFVIFLVGKSRKTEQRRWIDSVVAQAADSNMSNVIGLLIDFGINVEDEAQLDRLITQAKKEQTRYDIWKLVRKLLKGVTAYVLLPIITILLSKFFNDSDVRVLLLKALIIVLVCFLGTIIVSVFAEAFNEMIHPDIRKLEYFIIDIENIKAFPQKTHDILMKVKEAREKVPVIKPKE